MGSFRNQPALHAAEGHDLADDLGFHPYGFRRQGEGLKFVAEGDRIAFRPYGTVAFVDLITMSIVIIESDTVRLGVPVLFIGATDLNVALNLRADKAAGEDAEALGIDFIHRNERISAFIFRLGKCDGDGFKRVSCIVLR